MSTYSFKREIPVEDGYDVVVAGGGPGGCAAALSAARAGARVLLLEALGCLGGMGTAGLVLQWAPFMSFGKRVIGGIPLEIYQILEERGYAFQPGPNPAPIANSVSIHPEGLKLVLDELLARENVEVRFFTQAVDVDKDPERFFVNGIIIRNIEGFRYIKAKTFIDATGDASLVRQCGAECFEPDVAMAPTLCAVVDGVDWSKMQLEGCGLISGQQKVVDKAVEDGFFSQPDRHVPGIFRSFGHLGAMNAGHVFHLNSLNCRSLSDGMAKGRLQVQEYMRFFKTYFKEFSDISLVYTATLMGVRDSRRIKGEYWLTVDDYHAKRHFPDQIATNAQRIDYHVRDASSEEYKRFSSVWFAGNPFQPGEYYGVPYGTLVPKGAQNLWVAGRTLSCDTYVYAAMRGQLLCMLYGQAAGTAAAQAVATGQTANTINTRMLIESLRKQNCILPQEELSDEMTRS